MPTFDDVQAAAARLKASKISVETPVLRSEALAREAGATVLLKAECLQTTGSFKIRGAFNRLSRLPAEAKANGVVAFSSGNHAQGIARAAKILGMPALIVMPSDAPKVKVDGVKADGGAIHFYDRRAESREDIAAELAEARGAIVVPSFDDPDIIAGQGVAGLEFACQVVDLGERLDHLICCVGGGGLITGIALALSRTSPETKVWTAEPEGHDDWRKSLASREIRPNPPGTRSICDAILTPAPGELTWALGRELLAGGFAVSDAEVRDAMRFAFRRLKIVLEPGGAAALAVAVRGLPVEMRGGTVGIVATGGNVDAAQFAEIISADD